jgi:hypothetical protein
MGLTPYTPYAPMRLTPYTPQRQLSPNINGYSYQENPRTIEQFYSELDDFGITRPF